MAGPLSGYRILDLTTMISGPFGTMLLGDQGADVIKIETTDTGDLYRHGGMTSAGISSHFAAANRSKRSVALNLSDERGRSLLEKLVPTADVFIQNFRPGAIERMGFGEARLRELRPDIVMVSICGFGETGPFSGKRVYDPLIQAMSGMMHVQGGDGDPTAIRTILPDKLTAVTCAQAVTAALLERERSGQGQHVRLSMFDTSVGWMWPDTMLGDIWLGDRAQGSVPGERNLCFKTSDGFVAVCIASDSEWRGFCAAAERPDLTDHPRFSSPGGRSTNQEAFFGKVREIIAQRSSAYWLESLDKHDVPVAPLLTPREAIAHSQALANDLTYEREHPYGGRIREVRPAARFDRTRIEPGRHVPMHGEHTREVLAEAGVDGEEFEAYVAAGVVRAPEDKTKL